MSRADSVFTRDFAKKRSDELAPVTRCDRCIIFLGAVIVGALYVLLWCVEFIARAQQALHGVTT